MKRFCYHREFWMDFHFWILVLLLATVALTMQAPLSVVSLAYLAFCWDFDPSSGLSTVCIDTAVSRR